MYYYYVCILMGVISHLATSIQRIVVDGKHVQHTCSQGNSWLYIGYNNVNEGWPVDGNVRQGVGERILGICVHFQLVFIQ